jgi:hypothetical protein
MADPNKRVTVSVEELAFSNMMTLNALVELLHEKHVLDKNEVRQRVRLLSKISDSKPQ